MTRTVTTFTADSLLDAVGHAQKWMKDAERMLCWFRGVKDARLSLLPGAYWRTDYNEMDALLQFSQEGRAFAPVGEVDDWKTYYLAQHNGIPTRLLDWTENFVTALFFATDGWSGDTRPCVWVVQPECINQLSIGWSGLISPERNTELNAWTPSQIASGSQKIASRDSKWRSSPARTRSRNSPPRGPPAAWSTSSTAWRE